jgi:hypothetical protein
MFAPVDFDTLEVDETVTQLQALALAEAMLGDVYKAQIIKSLLALYVSGKVDISFTEAGEPIASIRPESATVVATPLFTEPSLLPLSNEPKAPIGFKPRN